MSSGALLSAAVSSLWLGLVLAVAARMALVALPSLGPGTRYRIWSLLLLITVGAPLLRPIAGSRPPGNPDPAPEEFPATDLAAALPADQGVSPAVIAPAPAVVHRAAQPSPSARAGVGLPAGLLDALLLAWLGGSLIGLAGLLRQGIALSGLKRRGIVPEADLLRRFDSAQRLIRPRRRVRLLLSGEVALPAACGYFRPAVLLPPRVLQGLAPAEVQHLLLHELAHLSRRDDWGLLLQRLLRICCWWHPVVWWLCRRLEAERELACDILASAPGDRQGYARTLVRLAGLARRVADASLAPGALRGEFTRRVEALVGEPPVGRSVRWRAPAGAAAIALVVAGAGLEPPTIAPRATTAPVPALDLPAAAEGPTIGARLDSIFSGFADSGFSGTVLVARGDRVLLEAGYGLADRARNIPTTAETRYSAAGMTKMFTAAAILTLAEEGRLRTSDSLARGLGPLPGPKAGVTLHQLLTHTDGLTRPSAPVYRQRADSFVRAAAATPASFAPGQGYRYNDFGHSLLGVVVEKASGERFEGYLRRRFLEPAGLESTGFEPDGGTRAVEYSGPAGNLQPIPPRSYQWGRRGSLGLVTTAHDLYRWSRALANPAVVPAAVHARMLETFGATDWGATQGYGWDRMSRPDGRVLWRRVAGTPGFEGELLYDPAGDWTAVILVNSRLGWRFRVWREIERALTASM